MSRLLRVAASSGSWGLGELEKRPTLEGVMEERPLLELPPGVLLSSAVPLAVTTLPASVAALILPLVFEFKSAYSSYS